ncbi:MAG: AzlC family ABC transporter permease [Firmicutes bacterium]|nr:AzlC family ABC transporter permease [Bacillota bacterium]
MKSTITQSLKAAFPKTIPIIPGYIFMGIAFGILLTNLGYEWYWPVLMAVVIFAGMAQFVSVNMLVPGLSFFNTFLFQFVLNARHIFYGLSMLEKFKIMGKLKPYMIFTMTDETYSILCSTKVPDGVSEKHYYFFIALLDHSYWILGCLLGGVVGSMITFNTTGIDFSMTAFFVTVVIDQWRDTKDHIPAICGFIVTAVCLIFFGAEKFIIPALLGITACLLLFRRRIEELEAKDKEVTADVE